MTGKQPLAVVTPRGEPDVRESFLHYPCRHVPSVVLLSRDCAVHLCLPLVTFCLPIFTSLLTSEPYSRGDDANGRHRASPSAAEAVPSFVEALETVQLPEGSKLAGQRDQLRGVNCVVNIVEQTGAPYFSGCNRPLAQTLGSAVPVS